MIKKSAKKTAPKTSKSKKSSKRKTPKASKGKKKGAVKSRRKKVMVKAFEVPVDVNVLIVPKVHLRVSMQVSEGEVVELQPVQSAPEEAPKVEVAGEASGSEGAAAEKKAA